MNRLLCPVPAVAPPCRHTSAQAVKRAERLTVSALAALSNFLEAIGDEANAELCVPGAHDATGFDEDGAQSHQVGEVKEIQM